MIKWFWRLLQHISAPSEKEIRESLANRLFTAGLIVFLSLTPAFAMTPDEMRGEAQRRYDQYIELEISRLYFMLSGSIIYTKETDSFRGQVEVKKGEFPEAAIRPAIEKMERQSWIVTMMTPEPNSNKLIFIITERKK